MNGTCSICDGEVKLKGDVHISEVVLCPDCKSRLVVESINKERATLSKAPEVEEDWGE